MKAALVLALTVALAWVRVQIWGMTEDMYSLLLVPALIAAMIVMLGIPYLRYIRQDPIN